MFPIPIPPPTSLSIQSLWVFLVHQVRAFASCIQLGLVICFTLDNIRVSMLFSRNIPPSPSPTESRSLFFLLVMLTVAWLRGFFLGLSMVKLLSFLFPYFISLRQTLTPVHTGGRRKEEYQRVCGHMLKTLQKLIKLWGK